MCVTSTAKRRRRQMRVDKRYRARLLNPARPPGKPPRALTPAKSRK